MTITKGKVVTDYCVRCGQERAATCAEVAELAECIDHRNRYARQWSSGVQEIEDLRAELAEARARADEGAFAGYMRECIQTLRMAGISEMHLLAMCQQTQAELSRLRAASQWQPIETAPKGTPVLLWAPKWICEIGIYCDGPRVKTPGWLHWEGSRPFSSQPTRWQPLPDPPAIDAAMQDAPAPGATGGEHE